MAGNNRLTWRDVAAPNFTGAGEMAARASNMLQQAVGGIGAGLEGFQDFQRDQAANYLARQTSQFTDPEALQAALASGAIFGGVDQNKFSANDLSRVNGRVSSLLDQASTRISNTNSQQAGIRNQAEFDLKEADRKWMEDNAGIINQSKLKAGAGGATAMSQELSNIPGITPARLNAILTGNMNYAEQANRLATSIEQGDQITRLNQRSNDQYIGTQEGNRLFTEQVRNGLFDSIDGTSADKVNAFINTMPPGIAKDTFIARASEQFPGMVKVQNNTVTSPSGKLAMSSAPGTAGTNTGSSYDIVLGGGQHGNTPKPATQMTAAEWNKFGTDVLIPATRNSAQYGLQGTGKGSSAMGFYQLTGETLRDYGPKVFGSNWQNTVMTPENQDKLGKALFDDRKNGDLTDTWKGLPRQKAGFYANKSWDEMKGLINQYESKTNPTASTASTASTAVNTAATAAPASSAIAATVTGDELRQVNELSAINKNIAQLGLSNFSPRMLAAKQRDLELSKTGASTPAAVATAAVGEGGAFAGMEKAELIKHITDVQTRLGGVSASEALEALGDAQSDRWDRYAGIPLPFGKNKPSIDTNRLDKIVSVLANGNYQKLVKDGAYAQQGVDSASRDVKEWSDQITDLKKKYNEALSLGSRGAPAAATYLAQIATAQEGLNKALGLAGTVNQAAGFPGATSPLPSTAPTAPPPQQQAPALIEAKVATPPASFEPAAKYGESKPAQPRKNSAPSESAKNKAQEQVSKLESELQQIQSSTALNDGVKMLQSQVKRNAIRKLKEEYQLT